MKPAKRILLGSLLLATAGLALLGCKSLNEPLSASFASVQITNHTPLEIRAATLAVFQQEGFAPAKAELPEMVFERQGSKWDNIAYGNWVDANEVWSRAKVSVVPLSGGVVRLQCEAFQVRDKGDKVFENEVRLRNSRSKPYQALLDKVLDRLRL
jgi:hypothetical protein